MSADIPQANLERLRPLPYHESVVAYLKNQEPEVWAWASSLSVQEQHVQDVRTQLLRETYRLSRESHGRVFTLCEAAMQRLGIEAPATLYQGGDGPMNAMLCYLPGEVHILFSGPVLERLDDAELSALLGHELSHYRLWSLDRGEFHVADRILNHTLADPGAATSHAETARLYGLYTEIYADRGAAVVADSPLPAVSTLVKVQTGLTHIDPQSYLQQAAEVTEKGGAPSQGTSHPEAYLRAQGLLKWWDGVVEVESWLTQRIGGSAALQSLDLIAQGKLTALTRKLIALFLQPQWMRTEPVLTQARSYFPDWRADEPALDVKELVPTELGDSVLDYMGCVLLDFALVDSDLRDEALAEALRIAAGYGGTDALTALLKKEVGLNKRQIDKLVKAAAKPAGK